MLKYRNENMPEITNTQRFHMYNNMIWMEKNKSKSCLFDCHVFVLLSTDLQRPIRHLFPVLRVCLATVVSVCVSVCVGVCVVLCEAELPETRVLLCWVEAGVSTAVPAGNAGVLILRDGDLDVRDCVRLSADRVQLIPQRAGAWRRQKMRRLRVRQPKLETQRENMFYSRARLIFLDGLTVLH